MQNFAVYQKIQPTLVTIILFQSMERPQVLAKAMHTLYQSIQVLEIQCHISFFSFRVVGTKSFVYNSLSYTIESKISEKYVPTKIQIAQGRKRKEKKEREREFI